MKLLPKDQVGQFILHRLSDQLLGDFIPFILEELLNVVPEEEIPNFIQRQIVQANLLKSIPNAFYLAGILACLPTDYIGTFLRQPTIYIKLLEWIEPIGSFRRILRVLPIQEIGPLLLLRNQYYPPNAEDLTNLLEQLLYVFNNQQQDKLLQCFIHMPELLQAVDTSEKIDTILDNSSFLKIDEDIFIENLIRIFQKLEKTDNAVLARINQYGDRPSLYVRFVLAYQKLTLSKPVLLPTVSDLLQHSWFAKEQEKSASDEPGSMDSIVLS